MATRRLRHDVAIASSPLRQMKLSGFLSLVVSVGARAPCPASGSSESGASEEDRAQGFECRAGEHGAIQSRCSDLQFSSDESEQSDEIEGRRTDCRYVCPCKRESKDKLHLGLVHDSEESNIVVADALVGAECWLDEEANKVVLQTNRGFLLRAICHSRLLQEFIHEIPWNADSGHGNLGSTDSDVTTEAEQCPATVEKSQCFEFTTSNVATSGKFYLEPDSLQSTTSNSRKGYIEVKEHVESKSRKKTRFANSVGDILHRIQVLAAKNCVELKGRVIFVASIATDVRAVVLLDLYLSPSLWSDRNYWKAEPCCRNNFQPY